MSRDWRFVCYNWKGSPYIALYRDERRLGYIEGETNIAHEMARQLGGEVVELDEVRWSSTIDASARTFYV
jgi:hypothetical protein